MKSGLAASLTFLRGLGTRKEQEIVCEAGVWPQKGINTRLWIVFGRVKDGEPDKLWAWVKDLRPIRDWFRRGCDKETEG